MYKIPTLSRGKLSGHTAATNIFQLLCHVFLGQHGAAQSAGSTFTLPKCAVTAHDKIRQDSVHVHALHFSAAGLALALAFLFASVSFGGIAAFFAAVRSKKILRTSLSKSCAALIFWGSTWSCPNRNVLLL